MLTTIPEKSTGQKCKFFVWGHDEKAGVNVKGTAAAGPVMVKVGANLDAMHKYTSYRFEIPCSVVEPQRMWLTDSELKTIKAYEKAGKEIQNTQSDSQEEANSKEENEKLLIYSQHTMITYAQIAAKAGMSMKTSKKKKKKAR